MNYEKILSALEYEVEQLKMTYGCKSWRSTCMSNDVIRKARELKEELGNHEFYAKLVSRLDAILGEDVK